MPSIENAEGQGDVVVEHEPQAESVLGGPEEAAGEGQSPSASSKLSSLRDRRQQSNQARHSEQASPAESQRVGKEQSHKAPSTPPSQRNGASDHKAPSTPPSHRNGASEHKSDSSQPSHARRASPGARERGRGAKRPSGVYSLLEMVRCASLEMVCN
ncbi:hypothetical protein DUNSADRAFT_20 [Dunaliella salina]|uniref:Encoded protein n=1 Tax=Dunaliella salina TaxID=3046 RepID=A0ABQ7HAM0_DUNSA|nr:hypothetical protein DUNSADRAFT_20 [Dunaliella salina]KAF5843898.1 hypothetical protein DUNSADRAFT_20 [Dunaliella salina]|eukprot:KAF5843897.1 hypothetical protein DUNSADRAFT_20 [Dunaliella salina]